MFSIIFGKLLNYVVLCKGNCGDQFRPEADGETKKKNKGIYILH
jgi:hypothetical protein